MNFSKKFLFFVVLVSSVSASFAANKETAKGQEEGTAKGLSVKRHISPLVKKAAVIAIIAGYWAYRSPNDKCDKVEFKDGVQISGFWYDQMGKKLQDIIVTGLAYDTFRDDVKTIGGWFGNFFDYCAEKIDAAISADQQAL